MRTLMVGYDLNRPGQAYSAIIAALKAMPQWWHYLDSTWLVRTDETPVQLRDRLGTLVDPGDELLVIEVTGRAAAWQGFAQDAGEWIKTNL